MSFSLNEWLWQETYWLPPNITWAELEDHDGLVFAHPRHLLVALPLALVLVTVRIFFERFVGLPLSRWMGVQDPIRRKIKPDPVLEKYFLRMKQSPVECKHQMQAGEERVHFNVNFQTQMVLLASQCGLTLRQTQRWFRRRRNQDRPCLSKKFCEASWRFVFYLCSFVGGTSTLYHESWWWTPALCWENYPFQTLNLSLSWWYLLELGFYISLLITLPFDIKRKDFKEQVLHHFVTVGLIGFSYCINLLRIGSVVLLLHDCSDYLMEACKMLNYAHFHRACDALFVIFALVFFYTRLIFFPTKVIHTAIFDSVKDRGPFLGYYVFIVLLVMLQLLHVYWFCLILRMIFILLRKGQTKKDIRSDVEESDSSDDDKTVSEGPQLKNGMAQGSREAITNGLRSRAAACLTNGHTQATKTTLD